MRWQLLIFLPLLLPLMVNADDEFADFDQAFSEGGMEFQDTLDLGDIAKREGNQSDFALPDEPLSMDDLTSAKDESPPGPVAIDPLDSIDLAEVKDLEQSLPSAPMAQAPELNLPRSNFRRKLPPTDQEIKASGIEMVSLREGSHLVRLSDGHKLRLVRPLYTRAYRLQNEHGMKLLINKDGKTTYAAAHYAAESIQEVTDLYRPPHYYTPAPTNIIRTEYDTRLSLVPEARLSAGFIQGDYMRDLFNDPSALQGSSVHYAANLFTQWDLPLKVGGGLNYEVSSYQLSGGGTIKYTSFSFGPLFRSRDLDYAWPLRMQAQFRVSPFSYLHAITSQGNFDLKFNSADLFLSAETPIKNAFGEFVFGVYLLIQWLNLRDQQLPVSLNATNETNKSLGFTLSQAFE